jgi:hypothetical protein
MRQRWDRVWRAFVSWLTTINSPTFAVDDEEFITQLLEDD